MHIRKEVQPLEEKLLSLNQRVKYTWKQTIKNPLYGL